MRIPVIKGIIKRRLLGNFRADPMIVHRLLPEPFRSRLHRSDVAVVRTDRERAHPAEDLQALPRTEVPLSFTHQ